MRSSLKITALLAGATLALASPFLAPAASADTGVRIEPNTDGYLPEQSLTLGSDGLFYGVVNLGGQHGYGALFQFDPQGTGDPLFLHSFTGENGDGANPSGPVTEDEDGNFYGVTEFGGPNHDGAIYTYTADGRYVALYDFSPDNFGFNQSSPYGILPLGALLEYAPNSFAGTVSNGLNDDNGGVFTFTVDPNSAPLPKIIDGPRFYTFASPSDGAYPAAGLISGPNGLLYGTAEGGGTHSEGTVFSFDPSTGVIHSLHSFSGDGSTSNNSDGAYPDSPLLNANGNLYGTTSYGGIYGIGTIYSIDSAGTHHTLLDFHGGNDGAFPTSGLAIGTNGDLWGVTQQLGKDNSGVIFDFGDNHPNPNRYLSYVNTDKANVSYIYGPSAGLTLGTDGLFYGVTANGGKLNLGSIYALDQTTFTYVTIHSFGRDLHSVANVPTHFLSAPVDLPGTVQAENYDLGGEGTAYHYLGTDTADTLYRLDNFSIEPSSEGGYDPHDTIPGQWLKYTVNVTKAGTYTFSYRHAGPDGGDFHLEDELHDSLAGEIHSPGTAGDQSWATDSVQITLPAGVHTLKLTEDTYGTKFDYFTFTKN